MGSFARAYREVVNRPVEYAKIMFYFLILAIISVVAPLGLAGLFSLIASYSNVEAAIVSLAGVGIYVIAFLLLSNGAYGALLKAIDARENSRDMGLDEMASYALGNCVKLTIINLVELAIIAFFAAIVLGTLYLLNIDVTRKLYLGVGLVILSIPALLVKYLFSLTTVSYVKSAGIRRSISKSFRITILRGLNYIPVFIAVWIVTLTLLIPFINIATVFLLFPMALLALMMEFEKLFL
jgi:hypothetical protein